jgi:nitroreductase
LITTSSEDPHIARKLGTYGNIQGATHFIAGAVERGERDLENFGFLLEEIILFATDLGLGTCWLGGTFSRNGFSQSLGLRPEERLPAVTPVGLAASDRGLRDRLLRRQAGSDFRKPWAELFFYGRPENPATPAQSGAYADVLEMVRLAPSASNHQPWRIIQAEDQPVFHFYLQRNAFYTAAAKALMQTDIQRVDMGIALCHFQWAAREAKLPGAWEVHTAPTSYPPGEYLVTWNGLA